MHLVSLSVGFILFLFLSCGSTSTSSSTSDDDDSGASTDFTISGTVSSLSVSSSLSPVKAATSGTISHVMAVNPTTGGTTCTSGTVGSDGTFRLGLTGQRPWFFYFFERERRRYLGRFRSSTLDTILPGSATGSTDLGTVTVDGSTGIASSSKSHSEIVSGLGLDTDTASSIGELDDAARRYQNPDTDGDGTIDCESSTTQKFLLDFHVRFDMKISGTRSEVNDIVDSYFSTDTTTAVYANTGVYVAYPTSYSSASTGSVTFETAVTTDEGGAITAGTATSSVTTNAFSGYNSFGPNISTASELPSGQIIFSFGSKTLTFDDVTPPSLAVLTAPTGRIFPFLKFNKTDSACSSNCTLSGVGYKWMKKSASGWTQPSLTELSLLVKDDSGTLSFRVDGDSGTTVQFAIPKTALEGTINWTSSSATLSGVSAATFEAITTEQICHVGLSYDDKLGMRYFQNIDNSNNDCAS